MKSEKSSAPPKLAPPGAGLPKIELLIARWIFGRFRKQMSREEITGLFVQERDLIVHLAEHCGPENAMRPIVIQHACGGWRTAVAIGRFT